MVFINIPGKLQKCCKDAEAERLSEMFTDHIFNLFSVKTDNLAVN